MTLEESIKGLLKTQELLHSKEGINNPEFMSENMSRLSQYTSSVESHLADIEKEYERLLGEKLHKYLVEDRIAVTKADKLSKVELSEYRANIAYLTRVVASSWKVVSTIQSRFRHLESELISGSKTT